MSSPVIEVNDLWFSFNGNPVLEDVNLTIHPRDFLAVIGPNGGGKTTLLKLILGLLEPDRGTVRVFGHSPREAAGSIGYVPQEIDINKGFPISVRDVVLMGRMRGGGGWRRFSRSDKIAARQALERVEMWEYRKRRIGELSGGQRQRVFMARALVGEPKILFLDEPTASVDQKGQTDFYALLKELNENTTVVVVSHDLLMVLSSYIKSVACVSQQVFFHDAPEITKDMLEMAYHCPVELIAHGVPHRVLPKHSGE
jgi:zinc transport system ATP-binding protein